MLVPPRFLQQQVQADETPAMNPTVPTIDIPRITTIHLRHLPRYRYAIDI